MIIFYFILFFSVFSVFQGNSKAVETYEATLKSTIGGKFKIGSEGKRVLRQLREALGVSTEKHVSLLKVWKKKNKKEKPKKKSKNKNKQYNPIKMK